MMERAIVCGGRDYLEWPRMFKVLDAADISRVIEGGADGADAGAAMWAFCRGIPYQTIDAEWDIHGRAAGPIRNQRMLEEGDPQVVIAFPGGRGTANMIRQAREVCVPVVVIP